jgi:uncharacterized membrane protein (UPF0136 family)
MLAAIRIFLFVFGILTVFGGVMGFVKAKSKPSLLAGSISGGLLIVSGVLVGTTNLLAGLILGALVSVALAGRFLPAFLKTKKPMPAGMMAVLSILGAILTIAGIVLR